MPVERAVKKCCYIQRHFCGNGALSNVRFDPTQAQVAEKYAKIHMILDYDRMDRTIKNPPKVHIFGGDFLLLYF